MKKWKCENSCTAYNPYLPRRRTLWLKYFTMLELLVVIAIIMILASVLLPALSKAKDLTRRMQCVNNMRTLNQQFSFYINDYNSYMVVPRTPPAGMWGGLVTLPTSAAYMTFNAPYLWCPSRSADKLQNIYHTNGYDYGLNVHISNIPYNGIWAKIDRVKYPSSSGYIFESSGHYQSLISLSHPEYMPQLRHMLSTNIIFIDGHAASSRKISLDNQESPWMGPYIGN